jgi:hypothetical protein
MKFCVIIQILSKGGALVSIVPAKFFQAKLLNLLAVSVFTK